MTREEALQWLNDRKAKYSELIRRYPCSSQLRLTIQVIDMAIEALSANCTTEKPNDVVEQKNDVVAEPTDLISRAELLDRIKAINSIPWGDDHGNAVKLVWSTEKVKRLIEKAPSADRPTGEWVSNNDGSWNCSECGLRVFIYAKGNYCPNCGAKMGSDTR